MHNPYFIEQSQTEEDAYFQELFPALRYIFCAEPQPQKDAASIRARFSFSKEV